MCISADRHFQRENKWFQIIRHLVFCNPTLKDNSGGFYVKEKIMTTLFTFLKRRNYKHNYQVGYSGMTSVLIVVKYACFLDVNGKVKRCLHITCLW